jgi:hypothetical protein
VTSPSPAPEGVRPAVVVIAVAALVVVALLVTGALPGVGRPAATPGEALSYSAARALADPTAAGMAGGPWSLYNVTGFDSSAAASGLLGIPNAFSYYESIHYLTSSRPQVPAYGGSLAAGLAPWWAFEYSNDTTDQFNQTITLVVVVVNGGAMALATESGPASVGIPPALPDEGLVDSPAMMAAAVASDVSLIGTHPGVNASFGMSAYASPALGLVWTVGFTTCSPFDQIFSSGTATYTGLESFVDLNSTTGSAVAPGYIQFETCSTYG